MALDLFGHLFSDGTEVSQSDQIDPQGEITGHAVTPGWQRERSTENIQIFFYRNIHIQV